MKLPFFLSVLVFLFAGSSAHAADAAQEPPEELAEFKDATNADLVYRYRRHGTLLESTATGAPKTTQITRITVTVAIRVHRQEFDPAKRYSGQVATILFNEISGERTENVRSISAKEADTLIEEIHEEEFFSLKERRPASDDGGTIHGGDLFGVTIRLERLLGGQFLRIYRPADEKAGSRINSLFERLFLRSSK